MRTPGTRTETTDVRLWRDDLREDLMEIIIVTVALVVMLLIAVAVGSTLSKGMTGLFSFVGGIIFVSLLRLVITVAERMQ